MGGWVETYVPDVLGVLLEDLVLEEEGGALLDHLGDRGEDAGDLEEGGGGWVGGWVSVLRDRRRRRRKWVGGWVSIQREGEEGGGGGLIRITARWVGGEEEDLTYLRVLVDEHEGVGHVPIAQVDDREAHPGPAFPLDGVQDAV